MLQEERICRRLCSPASYAKGIEELEEQAGEVDATVGCTWPPTLGGDGFSAFTATVSIGGDCHALVVVFRGSAGRDWGRYPAALFESALEMEGIRAFAPWVKTMKKVGHRLLS